MLTGTSGDVVQPEGKEVSQRDKAAIKIISTANDVEEVAELTDKFATEAIKNTGEILDKSGEAITTIGLVLASFTEGVLLALVPIGDALITTGKSMKIGAALHEGDTQTAKGETISLAVSLAVGVGSGIAITKSNEVGNITTTAAAEETIQTTAIGGVGAAFGKATDAAV